MQWDLGSTPGQGTRSRMPQLRVGMLQQNKQINEIPYVTTKNNLHTATKIEDPHVSLGQWRPSAAK